MTARRRIALINARVITPSEVIDGGHVAVEGARVVACGAGELPYAHEYLDQRGAYIGPGYIDLHVHGGGGADFGAPTAGQIRTALRFHGRHGTTALLATVAGVVPNRLTTVLDVLHRTLTTAAVADRDGSALLGIHLEGPFLNPARRGCQDERHLSAPSVAQFTALVAAAGGALRLMTIAPELPGALEVVAAGIDAGVVMSMGHTDATYEQAASAARHGIRHVTHLGNCMRPFHQREPGVFGAALSHSHLTCEVIVDGIAIHPAVVAMIASAKGPNGLVLITDAVAAAGSSESRFWLGDIPLSVSDDRVVRSEDGTTLAGSMLTMEDAVRNAVHLVGIPLIDAVTMASTTPARVLGIDDHKGSLVSGADADLVVLDEDLAVTATMVGGRWVHHR